ncbi:MAG: GDSL-type esterase/lipase family protein [Planctomycetota bacterium]
MARLLQRLLLALGGLALAALATEGLLRLLLPAQSAFYVWPPGLERTFRPSPGVMPGVEGESLFRINRLGLRGDDPGPSPAPRILCVGGSTTECLYLDQAEAWPQRVQAELGGSAWVGNAGVSGRLTRDHVVQLEYLLPQLGSLDRVVFLVGVNDLMLALGQDADYDPEALSDPAQRLALLPRAFEVLPEEYRSERFPRSTRLWRFFVPRLRGLLRPPQVQDEAGSIYHVWRRHRAETPTWIETLPDLAPALEEYRRNVAELARLTRAAGAEPLFLTQPSLWSADAPPEHEALLWMGGVGDYQKAPGAPYYASGALAEGMALYNRALQEACAALAADCLDLAALVPRDTTAFYDDVHFNEAGSARVAGAVAEALR